MKAIKDKLEKERAAHAATKAELRRILDIVGQIEYKLEDSLISGDAYRSVEIIREIRAILFVAANSTS